MNSDIPHRLRGAAIFSLGITLLCLVQRVLVAPIYNAGISQWLLSYVNSLASLLMVPGRYLSFMVIPPNNHHDSTLSLSIAYVITFALYTLLATLLWPGRRKSNNGPAIPFPPVDRPETDGELQCDGSNSAPAISRRAFIKASSAKAATVTITAAAGTGLVYSFLWEPKRLPVTHTIHRLAGLPTELEGLRIVQLADIHHGPWIPLSFVERMARIVNSLKPDIILLNGDFVSGHSRFIRPVVDVFSKLRANIGVMGALGNHDWWEGAGETRDRFKSVGIPLIDNDRMFLTPHRTLTTDAREGLCIAAVGDYWEDEIDFRRALRAVPDEMPRILLSHNPDVAEVQELARGTHRVDLMLSGHTHGGQIRVPIIGAPGIPSNYGQKYAQGLVQGPGCPVYVTRGIGMTVLPIRFCVPPEIAVHELRRG